MFNFRFSNLFSFPRKIVLSNFLNLFLLQVMQVSRLTVFLALDTQNIKLNFKLKSTQWCFWGLFCFTLEIIFLQYKGHFWGFLIHFSISTKGSVWYAIDAPYFWQLKVKLWQKWNIKTLAIIFWDLLHETPRASVIHGCFWHRP